LARDPTPRFDRGEQTNERAQEAGNSGTFGHGIEIGGVNYMIPVDAKLASDFDAPDEAIPLDRIVDAVTSARQLRLVILDACRDNPFVTNMKRRVATRSVSAGLAKVEPTIYRPRSRRLENLEEIQA